MLNWHRVPITVGWRREQGLWAVLVLTVDALTLSFFFPVSAGLSRCHAARRWR